MAPSRWNDQAIDGLRERVDDVDERTLTLPERVGRLEQVLVSALPERLPERFAAVEQVLKTLSHSPVAQQQGGFDWKLLLSVAATVVVPIVVAIIATKGGG